MRNDLYEEMYRLEADYWWHIAKRHLIKSLITKTNLSYSQTTLVDIGCGTGKFLEEMNHWQKWQELIGLDGADEAIAFTKKRKFLNVKKADFEKKLPLKNNSVDLITSLDVVEHIQNDTHLVSEFSRILKPGGRVMITVPAHQWLWTYWDEILGHKRRHNTESVTKLMKQAKLEIETISYFYSYLLPIAWLFRYIKTKRGKETSSDFIALPQWINSILITLARLETEVIKLIPIPFGLSVVCVAVKK